SRRDIAEPQIYSDWRSGADVRVGSSACAGSRLALEQLGQPTAAATSARASRAGLPRPERWLYASASSRRPVGDLPSARTTLGAGGQSRFAITRSPAPPRTGHARR